MTGTSDWLTAFPLQSATEAVDALMESWATLAANQKPGFHPKLHEPVLTKALKTHAELVTGRRRGLLGHWSAEDVILEMDLETAEVQEERRTDIVYSFNTTTQSVALVFEFKKMSRFKTDRDHYLGNKGLGRFVTGIYARGEAIAAMVAMLTDPKHDVLTPLCEELSNAARSTTLRLRPSPTGGTFEAPSTMFPAAEFDTEHDRDPHLAPTHGTIRVAHFFLEFGYSVSSRRSARSRKKKAAKAVPLSS